MIQRTGGAKISHHANKRRPSTRRGDPSQTGWLLRPPGLVVRNPSAPAAVHQPSEELTRRRTSSGCTRRRYLAGVERASPGPPGLVRPARAPRPTFGTTMRYQSVWCLSAAGRAPGSRSWLMVTLASGGGSGPSADDDRCFGGGDQCRWLRDHLGSARRRKLGPGS
jgi:hypothetical protein